LGYSRRTKILLAVAIAVLTFCTTLFTVMIERPVNSREEMSQHRTGYPFTFIRQDLSRYEPATFPQRFRFVDPRTSSFALELENFLASWAVFFGIAAGFAWGISRIKRRTS